MSGHEHNVFTCAMVSALMAEMAIIMMVTDIGCLAESVLWHVR